MKINRVWITADLLPYPDLNVLLLFPSLKLVLALYPQTTCFYRAVVDTYPAHVSLFVYFPFSFFRGMTAYLKNNASFVCGPSYLICKLPIALICRICAHVSHCITEVCSRDSLLNDVAVYCYNCVVGTRWVLPVFWGPQLPWWVCSFNSHSTALRDPLSWDRPQKHTAESQPNILQKIVDYFSAFLL